MAHFHRGKVAAFGALPTVAMPLKVLQRHFITESTFGGMG